MLAAIVRASNRYAMRPALVIDDRTYTYQELFGALADSPDSSPLGHGP